MTTNPKTKRDRAAGRTHRHTIQFEAGPFMRPAAEHREDAHE